MQHKLTQERPKRSPLAGRKPKPIENKRSSENIAKALAGRVKKLQTSEDISGASKQALKSMQGAKGKGEKTEILKKWKKQSRKR